MMRNLLILAVAILAFSINAEETTTIAPAYPPEFYAEIRSMYSSVETAAAGISVWSIGEHATGVQGAAWTSWTALATQVPEGSPESGKAYLASRESLLSLLPTEVQSYQSSLGNDWTSIQAKYTRGSYGTASTVSTSISTSISTSVSTFVSTSVSTTGTSSTAAAATGGSEKLAMGVAAVGAVAFGAVAALL